VKSSLNRKLSQRFRILLTARSKPISGDRTGPAPLSKRVERPNIGASLKQLKLQKARQVYADSLRAKNDVAVLLRPPSVTVAYDPARVKGDPRLRSTIVEFSDFQCPYCKKEREHFARTAHQVQRPGKARLPRLPFERNPPAGSEGGRSGSLRGRSRESFGSITMPCTRSSPSWMR